MLIKISLTIILIIFICSNAKANTLNYITKQKESILQNQYKKEFLQGGENNIYKITFFCACKKCCGEQAQGLTASGKLVKEGMIACNHLKFGTKVLINGVVYTVEDRGSKRYFGDFKNVNRHIDIYCNSHNEALKKGVKYLPVTIIN